MQLNSSIWWRNMILKESPCVLVFLFYFLITSFMIFYFSFSLSRKELAFSNIYQFNTAQFCSLSTSASKPHAPTVRECKNPTIISTHPFFSLSKLWYCLILKPLVSVDVSCPFQSQTLPNPCSAAGPLPNPRDSSSPSPDNLISCSFSAPLQPTINVSK